MRLWWGEGISSLMGRKTLDLARIVSKNGDANDRSAEAFYVDWKPGNKVKASINLWENFINVP